jgi:SAM-dependent methyltransferase
MDRDRRNNLKRVVNRCRKILEKDIELCLLAYGIKSDGEMLKLALSEEKLVHQGKLEEAIDKEISGGLDRPKAVKRYIRHVGFTYLNRIAALRAMEVRELIKETIIRREKFGGRSHRERDISETNSLLSPDELLTTSLVKAFEAVGNEINVLFDMNNEYSLLVPNAKALREVIQLLTVEVTEDDWKQDDIIGWIYQYYNEEARKEFKASKRKPTADDIPVINQFYTPHWVVRVLTDNTLGRLWLEQQGRCSILIEKEDMKEVAERRAGIPDVKDEPERFKDWLRNPQGETVDTFCSYFVPLMNEPQEREKKRAREIKVLDPACGSGHFLIYAFDVLYRIYIEDEPATPKDEIPNLILENNLFGIDIDLRAVQLAALSLFLKAKSYNPDLKIRKMNLICADSHIADGKKRRVFLQRFNHDPALQEIFAKLFEDLNNTNELGSLLKVREPFEKLFAPKRNHNRKYAC